MNSFLIYIYNPLASGIISNLYYTFRKHLAAYCVLGTRDGYNNATKQNSWFYSIHIPMVEYQVVGEKGFEEKQRRVWEERHVKIAVLEGVVLGTSLIVDF